MESAPTQSDVPAKQDMGLLDFGFIGENLNRRRPYETGLDRNPANYVALSPLSFLARTAEVYPDRPAVIHGDQSINWAQTYRRCCRLASALTQRGIGIGDTVAVVAPNVPAMYEAHFGVPMCGAVLNTLNTRLDPEAIAFMLNHGEAKALLTDREFYQATVAKLVPAATKVLGFQTVAKQLAEFFR